MVTNGASEEGLDLFCSAALLRVLTLAMFQKLFEVNAGLWMEMAKQRFGVLEPGA